MATLKIGIFDSGIGGLTVAREIKKQLPQASLIYVADNARAPYGPRKPSEILDFSKEITAHLLQQGAQIIVVACNTATSAAIDQLRASYPQLPFVGMEPAVKPAAALSKTGIIGVMATELTLNGDRYQDLVQQFAPDAKVLSNPCKGLIPLIEQGDWYSTTLKNKLESILHPMMNGGIDTLVLGCTHYPLLLPQIKNIVGETVTIIDPAPAAARQTLRLLKQLDLTPTESSRSLDIFSTTASSIAIEKALSRMQWRWRWCGILQ